jgi:hypothetical protein
VFEVVLEIHVEVEWLEVVLEIHVEVEWLEVVLEIHVEAVAVGVEVA